MVESLYPTNKPYARIWQDPFEPYYNRSVQLGSKTNEEGTNDHGVQSRNGLQTEHDFHLEVVKTLQQSAEIQKADAGKRPFMIMGIMVPSGPFEDRTERRQRLRFALASGMLAGGYAPKDSEHIGNLQFELNKHRKDIVPPENVILPYEWYSKLPDEEQRYQRTGDAYPTPIPLYQDILVFWIPDDICARRPLACLADIRRQLNKIVVADTTEIDKSDLFQDAEFSVFGPWSSTSLKKMIEESMNPDTMDLKTSVQKANISLHNVFATADVGLLLGKTSTTDLMEITAVQGPSNNIHYNNQYKAFLKNLRALRGLLQGVGVKELYYQTCPDSLVIEPIGEELLLRGFDLEQDNVVLISEFDTFFGRSLPRSFRCSFTLKSTSVSEPVIQSQTETQKSVQSRIKRFSYLRGLDGRLPTEDKTSPFGAQNPNNDKNVPYTSLFFTSQKQTRSEGNSQFDYVLRLADEIALFDKMNTGNVRAIGILGSDVYDKLLLLQVLRPLFPNAVFFTTDLDVVFWHPNELKWTKNLIVGTSYGVSLHPELQRGVAPFRFSYQTAFFRGLLETTTELKEKMSVKDSDELIRSIPLPRLFEIGANGPCDLSMNEASTGQPPIHPVRLPSTIITDHLRQTAVQCLVVFFLLLTILVSLDWHRGLFQIIMAPAEYFFGIRAKARTTVVVRFCLFTVLVTTVFLCLLCVICFDHFNEFGEPYSWGSGTSTWPSAIFHLCAVILAISLYFNTFRCAEKFGEVVNDDDFDKTYAILCPAGKMETIDVSDAYTADAWSDMTFPWRDEWKNLNKPRFTGILVNVFITTALLTLVVIATLANGHSPYRGELSYCVGMTLWIASWLGLIVLSLRIFVLNRRVIRFVDSIPLDKADTLIHESTTGKNGFQPGSLCFRGMIRFLANATEKTNEIVLYPIPVLLLMFLAKLPFFDYYGSTFAFRSLAIFMIITIIFAPTFYLRHLARFIRWKRLDSLRKRLPKVSDWSEDKKVERQCIQYIIEETEKEKRGIFEPIMSHPLMQAIILLVGGASISVFLLRY